MKYSTHIITAISVSTTLIAYKVLPTPTFEVVEGLGWFPVFILIITISSLLPDLDHGNSYISNKLKIPIHYLFKHRGFTHQIWMWGLAIWYGLSLSSPLGDLILWVGVGALLHTFGDMHTKGGVKLFGFEKRGWTVIPYGFKTGGAIEYVVSVGYIALFLHSYSLIF
jgi:membrane-bound metal-dependent hydrolase YbcI (DUF457 family)